MGDSVVKCNWFDRWVEWILGSILDSKTFKGRAPLLQAAVIITVITPLVLILVIATALLAAVGIGGAVVAIYLYLCFQIMQYVAIGRAPYIIRLRKQIVGSVVSETEGRDDTKSQ